MNAHFPKLFVTDLDGTALGGGYRPYAKLPTAFSAFLHQLAGRGCRWATCTTWESDAQRNLLHASPEAPPPAYVVVGSGLQILTYQQNELIRVEPYSGDMAYKQDEIVRGEMYPLIRDVCSRFDSKMMNFNGYWFSMTVQDSDVERMMDYMGEKASQLPLLKIERIAEEKRFYVHPAFLRKGTPVKELQRLMDLTPDDIVVAGDEMMDLDMMMSDASAHWICPSNAHPAVKQRVLERNGVVGGKTCSDGIMEAFYNLARAKGWDFNCIG
jgi:hydroxymethylpyrimidine pyrophosphatase-like HAD family hydrolase